ncbi:hypothetical protein ABFY48_24080 [Lysinibacillus pakistanensis]|uniref:hypothetical protein n=1 Tax=Lysinibacillus pakistanensis TaxID=759811 RepID=UPI003D2BB99F
MNQSTISESFGEQLAIITAGTKYAVIPEGDTFLSELEHRVRKIMYSLWMDAQANKLANYLEKKQSVHFAQLYEFSYGVSIYDNDQSFSSRTDSLALMIIDKKAAYRKEIERLRLQYKRFLEICNQLGLNDKELIVSYFERSQKVEYEALRFSMQRNLTMLERIYTDVDREKESQVIKEARGCTAQEAKAYHTQHEGKQQYLIHGRYEYLTLEEHTAYQHKQSNLFEVHGNEERIGEIGY